MRLSTILETPKDTQYEAAWGILRGHFEEELKQLAKEYKIKPEEAAQIVARALEAKGGLVLFSMMMRGLKKKNPEGWRIVQAQKAKRAQLLTDLEQLVLQKAGGSAPPMH